MAGTIRFSVVTPTHRRRESLLRMLDALARQDYPFDSFEVIVVIDGPDGELLQALRTLRTPYRLTAVGQPQGGPAAARNLGLDLASEPFVLFIDDDVLPFPGLISQHAESHRGGDVVVIGPLLAAEGTHPQPWTLWEWSTLQEQYRAMESGAWLPTPRQFYTGNASVRLEHVRSAGGFRVEFRRGEDVELAWRLHDRGLHFVFNPMARAEHLAERSFDAWLKAAREYGRTDVMLERLRTGRDLPGWVCREFRGRHLYTRVLTRAALGRPEILAPMALLGRTAAQAAGRLRWKDGAGLVCSALFTAAYWRGVADLIGREGALALTDPGSGPAAAETAA